MIINNISVSDFRRYLELKRNLGPATVKKYISLLAIVRKIAGECEYTENAILQVYEVKREEGKMNSTLNNYFKLFRLLDKFTGMEATKELQKFTEEKADFDVLSINEISKIHGTSMDYTMYDKEFRALYLLLSETGLRIEEALSITADKVHEDYVSIYSTKTNRWDSVLVSDSVIERLKEIGESEGKIFPFSSQMVFNDLQKRCKKLGITKHVNAKTFRKTYGTLGVDENLSLYAIMEKLRHTNLNSMIPYIRKSKERQRELLMLHPITMERLSGEKFFTALVKKAKKLEEYNDKKGVSVSCVKETDDEYVVRIKKV